MRSLIQAQEFIASNATEAAARVARFLRQDRAFIAEPMTKVDYRTTLTPDSVASIQRAIDQLRGMNRLSRKVTPAELSRDGPLKAVAPDRARI
jgi:hypothetical protein